MCVARRYKTKNQQNQILTRHYGGDGGIRTLDRALQPYNGLANRRLQPLGHISATPLGLARDVCPSGLRMASGGDVNAACDAATASNDAPDFDPQSLLRGSTAPRWQPLRRRAPPRRARQPSSPQLSELVSVGGAGGGSVGLAARFAGARFAAAFLAGAFF